MFLKTFSIGKTDSLHQAFKIFSFLLRRLRVQRRNQLQQDFSWSQDRGSRPGPLRLRVFDPLVRQISGTVLSYQLDYSKPKAEIE